MPADPQDGSCSPLTDADALPDGYIGVRCLRCTARLYIHVTVWRAADRTERARVLGEHHMWLCPVPTPHVAAMRAAAAQTRGDPWP